MYNDHDSQTVRHRRLCECICAIHPQIKCFRLHSQLETAEYNYQSCSRPIEDLVPCSRATLQQRWGRNEHFVIFSPGEIFLAGPTLQSPVRLTDCRLPLPPPQPPSRFLPRHWNSSTFSLETHGYIFTPYCASSKLFAVPGPSMPGGDSSRLICKGHISTSRCQL